MIFNVVKGKFIERPNRFIAYVEVNGVIEKCHVKNTGRCKELLIKGVTVYLEEGSNPNRKTKYSLVAVEKEIVLECGENDKMLINIDSQAPNKMVKEWLEDDNIIKPFGKVTYIKAEKTFEESRLDFYFEAEKKAYMEVKGVTLIEGDVARFPDAPTERGIKHIEHLIKLKELGYDTYIMFVIQCKGVNIFEPNDKTHKAFGDALRKADKAGVKILAYDCIVKPGEVIIDKPVKVSIKAI